MRRARPATATGSTSASRGPARRSSLPSERALFGGIYARGETAAAADRRGLAAGDARCRGGAGARLRGRGPDRRSGRRARSPPRACAERFDWRRSAPRRAQHATPVVPLVAALRGRGRRAGARRTCTPGATSQDVLDTALMLIAHRALGAAARRRAPLPPTRRRGWPTRTAARRWSGARCSSRRCRCRSGCGRRAGSAGIDERPRPAGGHARRGAGGPDGRAGRGPGARRWRLGVAAELGLAEPVLPWHTIRVRPASAGRRARARWPGCSARWRAT